jgi:antitoxin component YwqK of YwqJK toxin-antitoxin module
MNLLNNNIIEYVLNEYLDYEEDISKLKQLFLYKFNIRKHLSYNFYRTDCYTILDSKGIRRTDYNKGNKICVIHYKNGQYHGNLKKWYPDGKLLFDWNYKNNKMHGIQFDYHKNGKISHRYNVENDIEEGYHTEYYENGNKKSEGNYTKNMKNGIFLYFHYKGDLNYKQKYEMDELIYDESK